MARPLPRVQAEPTVEPLSMTPSAASPKDRIVDWQKRIDDEKTNLGIQLAKELAAAADTFKVLESVSATDIWKDPQYEQHLTELKLSPASQAEMPLAVAKARKPRVVLDADKVLDFIGEEEKAAGDVQKKFECSYVTAGKFLEGLLTAKKLMSRKDGRTTLYKVKK